jgi:phosphoglycerate dehydrogenase-like enzyme
MAELPLIVMTHPLPQEWTTSLNGRVRSIVGPSDIAGIAPALLEYLKEAEGLLCLLSDKVDSAILSKSTKMRVVSNMAAGVDNVDLPECTSRKIPVGNTPGILTDATADLTMALLLSAARRIPEASADARNGLWKLWAPAGWLGADLRGATLGIIGMGNIGKAVADRAIGFGLNILYHGYRPQESAKGTFVALEDLLAQSDFITIHAPLNQSTKGMIDEKSLKRMKKNAILLNVARGPIVNIDALVKALREHWIAGAALDVTDPEPLPPDHPLFDLPNCLVVPHIGSATRNTRKRMAEMACENLLAGLDGKRLPHCANPEIYE